MEDPLLIAVAIATSIGAIAGIIAVYYTRHSHERSERWRRIDRLKDEFDSWSEDMQVEDPYWIHHWKSDSPDDGRAAARETTPKKFNKKFDRFIEDSTAYEKSVDALFESVRQFCEAETGMKLESNVESEIPEGFCLQPLFARILLRVAIYRAMNRPIPEIEYETARFPYNSAILVRNGIKVTVKWWPGTGESLFGEIARHVVDGPDKVVDIKIDEKLERVRDLHETWMTGDALDQIESEAKPVIETWNALKKEASALRSELVHLRAG
jgi:hypothetical protein